jgi:hypothetical protein
LISIRKTGGYQVPDNPMDALKLMFQAQEETKEEINSIHRLNALAFSLILMLLLCRAASITNV